MLLYESHFSKLSCIPYSETLSFQNLNTAVNSTTDYSTENAINISG